MNHRETGSFTPSIKYHRAVPRIPAVLLKVYLKGLDSPKALRADIVFEPRKREREREREFSRTEQGASCGIIHLLGSPRSLSERQLRRPRLIEF